MATASTNPIIPQGSINLPANLNSFSGFGDGPRFHYHSDTQQAEWSHKRYQNYYSNASQDFSGQNDNHAGDIPLYATPRLKDETSLTPYDRLAFATEISILYHTRRHAHYDNVFRMMMLSIIVLSGFAFVSGVDARAILGLSIIGIAAGSVIWNVTQLSRLHDVLRSEYQGLMEMIRMTPAPRNHDLRLWRNMRLRIRQKEPAIYWAVANECYYDAARAWELEPKKREGLPLMLRPFKNWFRF